jgi:hypothetical protein
VGATTLMPPKKRPKGRPKSLVKRGTILSLKGTAEFGTWLAEFAEFCNLTQAETIGQALVAYAETRGFRAPPRR